MIFSCNGSHSYCSPIIIYNHCYIYKVSPPDNILIMRRQAMIKAGCLKLMSDCNDHDSSN